MKFRAVACQGCGCAIVLSGRGRNPKRCTPCAQAVRYKPKVARPHPREGECLACGVRYCALAKRGMVPMHCSPACAKRHIRIRDRLSQLKLSRRKRLERQALAGT